MKTLILLIMFMLVYPPNANAVTVYGDAPFCMVDDRGFMAQCYYYSMKSCLTSLQSGHFCVMR